MFISSQSLGRGWNTQSFLLGIEDKNQTVQEMNNRLTHSLAVGYEEKDFIQPNIGELAKLISVGMQTELSKREEEGLSANSPIVPHEIYLLEVSNSAYVFPDKRYSPASPRISPENQDGGPSSPTASASPRIPIGNRDGGPRSHTNIHTKTWSTVITIWNTSSLLLRCGDIEANPDPCPNSLLRKELKCCLCKRNIINRGPQHDASF